MHPVLVNIPTPWGAIPIYSYGVMLGSSLLFAWYFIMYMGKKIEGYNRELLASCFTWTAVGAIVGARLLYIFTNLDSYDSVGSWFDLRSGGLVAYGGFLGGFVSALTFWRIKKIPLLPFGSDVHARRVLPLRMRLRTTARGRRAGLAELRWHVSEMGCRGVSHVCLRPNDQWRPCVPAPPPGIP
ncbi:MAG: prolipoprotein diacylglyceryl transferase [Deltaproteobacteria bacterium]|nr:prolipoprotein diacylglyceryl transferase [Deltaproteobacteria bacterium]